MKQIISGIQYDTDTATEIAHDRYWDGSNHDRNGRNMTLYKTAKGRFFVHHETRWQAERDHIRPVDLEEAMELYERLPVQPVDYFEAFGIHPEEA